MAMVPRVIGSSIDRFQHSQDCSPNPHRRAFGPLVFTRRAFGRQPDADRTQRAGEGARAVSCGWCLGGGLLLVRRRAEAEHKRAGVPLRSGPLAAAPWRLLATQRARQTPSGSMRLGGVRGAAGVAQGVRARGLGAGGRGLRRLTEPAAALTDWIGASVLTGRLFTPLNPYTGRRGGEEVGESAWVGAGSSHGVVLDVVVQAPPRSGAPLQQQRPENRQRPAASPLERAAHGIVSLPWPSSRPRSAPTGSPAS